MGLKSLANKAKGKRPFIEEEDSDFAPPLTKRGRAPPKKKTKVRVQEKMAEDVYGKNNNVGAAVRTEGFETSAYFHLHGSLCTAEGLVHVVFL
ncbi:hypothetical protein CsatB_029833 [Cannabis sativa]